MEPTGHSLQEFPAIQTYGLIGDCRAAAPVSRDASIEFLDPFIACAREP